MIDVRSLVFKFRLLRYPAVATVLIGCAISLLASIWLYEEEEKREALLFQQEANMRFHAFDSAVGEMVGSLALLCRRFGEPDGPSAEQFDFASQMFLEKRPYVLGFTYHSQSAAGDVREAKIQAHDEKGRFLDTQLLKSRTDGDILAPIGTMVRAIINQSGLPVAPRIVPLAPRHGASPFWALVAPVQGSRSSPGTVVGYANAVFRIEDLARSILQNGGFLDDAGTGIALYDGGAQNGAAPVFVHGVLPPNDTLSNMAWFRVSRMIDVAGHEVRMEVAAEHETWGMAHTGSWLTLIGGFLITLVVASCFQILVAQATRLSNANETLAREAAERERVRRELQKSQFELRKLAMHQEQVREDERKRIAREIHDDLGQNLLALRIGLTLLNNEFDRNPQLASQLDALFSQLDVTIKSVRSIINDLRPAVLDLGLHAAIEWLVNQMNQHHHTLFDLFVEGDHFGGDLDDERATSIFRIVQESMTNIVRHANARSAEIHLSEKDGRLAIQIVDDGVGSARGDKRKPRSFGLIGIRERITAMGGDFRMQSIPGKGTSLAFTVPVDDVEDEAGHGRFRQSDSCIS